MNAKVKGKGSETAGKSDIADCHSGLERDNKQISSVAELWVSFAVETVL